ncbi:hypothetical protein [Hyalangium sp.]|uniref:hypothetical protein n=1 Tax=Hyalangium sp. TaxID=2028555 RepID=UPI002D47F098|nr:hypothetical protein [Hyalangium sp.]HYH98094.1 hypothetical protein [Hyalangium sp.]
MRSQKGSCPLRRTVASSSTHPGITSQRNLERLGFRIAYPKVVLVREKISA